MIANLCKSRRGFGSTVACDELADPVRSNHKEIRNLYGNPRRIIKMHMRTPASVCWPLDFMIPKRSLVVVIAATVCFVALSTFKAHRSLSGQAILFLLTPVYASCLVVSVIELFRGWRTYKLHAFIPLIACALAWYGSYPVGSLLRSWLFIHDLPRFQSIVDGVHQESLPVDGEIKVIPISKADQSRIQRVFAHQAAGGTLIVEFGTENGFPVKHSGYVYSSSGILPSDPQFHYRWPYTDEVQPKWFRVSD